MSYIYEALNSSNTGEDFVQSLCEIYNNPSVSDELQNCPDWVKDIIVILNYDTDLQMEGLDFKSYDDEIKALEHMGLYDEADALRVINSESSNEEMESCYKKLALNNDYEAFWNEIFAYAEKHMSNNK